MTTQPAARRGSYDWQVAVSLGMVPGHALIQKFGRNPEIDTGTVPEDVWDGTGLYTGQPLTAAETVALVSDAAADAAAGTGARTVTISGLGAAWQEQTQTLTLNGATPVVSSLTWRRVNRMWVETAGSGGTNAGVLALTGSVSGSVFATMIAGYAQTTIGAWTVPLGKTAYVLREQASMVRASGAAGSGTLTMRVREPGGVYRARDVNELSTSFPLVRDLSANVALPTQTDIVLRIENVSDNNTIVSAQLTLLVIDDG